MKTNRCTKLCKRRLLPFLLLTVLLLSLSLRAQVTVGSSIPPTRTALLDLKARQTTATIPSANADENITSALGDGGLLLPRVNLIDLNTMEPFIVKTNADWLDSSNLLKYRLTGLMVYNVKDDETNGFTPGVYIWDGEKWGVKPINEVSPSIVKQPEPFTFYEKGTETAIPLTFAIDGLGEWKYQWYQATSNNAHVNIGTAIAGATKNSFTPTVLNGTTLNANFTGFYRFYCVATRTSDGKELISNIAEVAVGCGAKNNNGEWITFMCFNLGAENDISIKDQMNTSKDDQAIYGSLFQWGRIADDHELRSSDGYDFANMTDAKIGSGFRCRTGEEGRPWYQVAKGVDAEGMFIYGGENWTPVAANIDNLWKSGSFVQNDPCTHYNTDGSYQKFWFDGPHADSDDPIGETEADGCKNATTRWRLPSQAEWGSIYRGGTISGTPDAATANSWFWSENIGMEVKPDGATTTLFLPANGYRSKADGKIFENKGTDAYYWSYNIISSNAYNMHINNNIVEPANGNFNRSNGLGIRCIKR
ncbi:uncharacterized protein (TIGR02145 family) [Dysgonomonas sp. PH5-45]|uniref:hypothetical protein n=1 Tax=unclassified Dysgonomonas TaxID=2630389 RepID=UPI002475D334|nr:MULTISPECIES: hypothetical protein [unclassified Dysgonomonas]MDH6355623.1 uncharacterized protein (TIGR02145 family) [Dysgonomonas sp. PH5-45]MDH6388520.1 uncharacterized protein (TIGR02145 family) [Dysgonomonas sp. PH5-37]